MSLVRILATVGASLAAAAVLGLAFEPESPGEALRPAPAAQTPAAPASASLTAGPRLADPALPAAALGGAPEAGAEAAMPVIAMLTPDLPPDRRVGAAATERADAPAPDGADCAITAELAAQPAAMLALRVHAPCDAGEPLAISHGPLRLAQPLGPDGRLALELPALAGEARVTLAMLDGRVRHLWATVPDHHLYPRVAVLWEGPAVLELHAFAGGAGWGDPGHVQAGGAVSAATGFVTALGDPEFDGPQARIYTYPVGVPPTAGHVALEAQIAVTPASCGRPFSAEVMATPGPGRAIRRRLSLDLPPCDGPAGFVLVPELLPDAAGLAALP